MDALEFVTLASATGGLEDLTRQALAGQVDRLGQNRFSLVLPMTRRPFETYGAMHFHQGFELALQLLGISRWELLDGHVEVPAEAMLLIPRGVPHTERLGKGASCSCNLNIYVSRDLITYHGFAFVSPGVRRMPGNGQARPQNLELIFDMLAEAVAGYERGGADSALVRGLLLAALSMLLEAVAEPDGDPAEGSRLVSLCRQEVMRYLCNATLNVGWLAEHLGCNADYLSHLFRSQTGQRLNAFINEERVKLGRYLLQSSTLSIGEVASSCGYADPDYFSRVFRRAGGQSPGEFRAAVRHAGGEPAQARPPSKAQGG